MSFCFHRSVPFEKRIATLLEWLSLPEGERYCLLYYYRVLVDNYSIKLVETSVTSAKQGGIGYFCSLLSDLGHPGQGLIPSMALFHHKDSGISSSL